MSEQLQKIPMHGARSHGARLLAAIKDKGAGGRPAGTPAYRGPGTGNPPLPFPTLVPPSPAKHSMPSRRDGCGTGSGKLAARGGGQRDPYAMDGDDDNEKPASTSAKNDGLSAGKRLGAATLGGSEPKKQAQLPLMFSKALKKSEANKHVPAGIVNMGNTCYMNSVIQVLLNMPTFASDLADPTLERLRQNLPATGVWMGLRATADKLRTAAMARPSIDNLKPAVEPTDLRAAMGRRSSRWRGYGQQDAHEFLVELLEALQNEVLAAEAAASGRRRVRLSATRCPTARNLGGCLVHTWTCSVCGRETRTKEPFSCLSLQLPAQGSVKLQDMMADYLKDETIDKNCDGCSPSAPVAHTAQHRFWRLPRVLVVHIKRFMPLQQQPQLPAAVEQQTGSGPVVAVDQPDDNAEACPSTVPGTPTRVDTRVVTTYPPSVAPPAPAPTTVRDTSPVAPYIYSKVHTVVDVLPMLELAKHCDATARAHPHLVEGVPPAEIARRVGDMPGGSPVVAIAGDGAATTARPGISGRPALSPTIGGCTFDTFGGGSTCPSPSFQPQERTVQKAGPPPTVAKNRHPAGGLTSGALSGPAPPPPDSQCYTSAMSTGAQGVGNGEAPTPHGGVVPASVRQQEPGQKWKQQDLSFAAPSVGGGTSASAPHGRSAGKSGEGHAVGFLSPHVVGVAAVGGVTDTPHAQIRTAIKGQGGQPSATPACQPLGLGRQHSALTGNDELAGLALPGSTARSNEEGGRDTGVDGGAGGSTVRSGPSRGMNSRGGVVVDAVAGSERKAPKALATGNFFGGGTSSRGKGDGCAGGDEANGTDLDRPRKRLCVDERPEALPSQDRPDRTRQTPFARSAGDGPTPSDAGTFPRQVEDMTEEEQLELALRISLMEPPTSAPDPGAASGGSSGPDALGGTSAPVLVSVPTAAPRRSNDSAVVVTSDSRQGGGHEDGGVEMMDWQLGEGEPQELQDESPAGGGTGEGRRSGKRRISCGSQGDSEGSSGGIGRYGSGALDRRQAARLDRSNIRREASFLEPQVPDAAESPVKLRPSRNLSHKTPAAQDGKPMEHGTWFQDHRNKFLADYGLGDPNNQPPTAAADEDDGTTALSPLSTGHGRARPPAAADAGALNRQFSWGRFGPTAPDAEGGNAAPGASAHTPDVNRIDPFGFDPYGQNGQNDESDIEKAMRLSLETFAAEQAGRHQRDDGMGAATFSKSGRDGAGPAVSAKPQTDATWQDVLNMPDVDQGPEQGTALGCGDGRLGMAGAMAGGAAGGGREAATQKAVVDAILAAGEVSPGVFARTEPARDATETEARDHTDLVNSNGRRRRRQQQQDTGAGNETGEQTTNDETSFRFDFPFTNTGDESGGRGAGGLGLGDGSRKEAPLDLTGDGSGGYDDDAALKAAIMLSLQDANDNAWCNDAAGNGDLGGVVHFDGTEFAAGPESAASPKPKVSLVTDSDCGEDDEGDCEGEGPSTAPQAATASGPAPVSATPGGLTAPPSEAAGSQPLGGATCARGPAAGLALTHFARYVLRGVVRHKGLTPFSGHYVADVLVPNSGGKWYEHNDAVVSHVDFARVQVDAAKQGYLLFFVNAVARAANPAGEAGDAATGAGSAQVPATAETGPAAVSIPGDSVTGLARND